MPSVHVSLQTHAVLLVTAGLSTGCLAPCPAPPAGSAASAGNATATTGMTASASTAESSSPAAATATSGASGTVLWDGDDVGGNAKPWADCDSKPDCKSTAQIAPNGGRNNSMGIKFEATGKQWIGFGWNLFGWWPQDAGYDATGHEYFTFWMRAEADDPANLPQVDSLQVSLVSSGEGEGRNSANGSVKAHADGELLDGKWHEVKIPLSELNTGKTGPNFNPSKVWEFTVSTWAATAKKFTLYFDDVALQ